MSSSQHTYVAIVDDDDNVCRSLGRLLRAANIQPILYPSAEAFLADTKHPQFDCLVFDIQLPGMSGLKLSQKVSAEGRTTPIIFITADDEPDARAEAAAMGIPYFRKTDSGAAVLDSIRRATGRSKNQ